MARQYWGLNRGQTEFQVVTSSTDPATDFEISYNTSTVDPDKAQGRMEFVQALEQMINAVMKGNWPPA